MIHIEGQLIEDACKGNLAAIEKLLLISQPDLKRFARRSCATSEDAEDAVQVALWKLHRKIGTLRAVSALASWMFRIIERECYRLFRMQRKTEELTELVEESMQHPPEPHALRQDLAAAMSALPAEYREVLILRDVDEFTAPEVAAHLNISVSAVKSRLHRARAMMREGLMASGYVSAYLEAAA
ncbi:RNA polymerase sigma factor [Janthinobacterium sp.]|uniref:RNA polymerase sigma factor n=1 Tax=Janthinobacterium sp. TaxID=1871054 RepID=UPI00293D282A|nr:RNA polymerase sigma factor [Janthinobacterium sp.]